MGTAIPKTHYVTPDVEPSTSTSEPQTVKTCLTPDVEPSTSTVEPSTSTAEPKTVKICHPLFCSKCSKKIRRPKVQKPKKTKKTPSRKPKRQTSRKSTPPGKRANKGKGKQPFGHYLLKEQSTDTGKKPIHRRKESSRTSKRD